MTTRIERIKEALQAYRGESTMVAWHDKLDDYDGMWDEALAHFLADKSLTGARIKDLRSVNLWEEVAGEWAASRMIGTAELMANGPDEAIAELWRKVFIDEPGVP